MTTSRRNFVKGAAGLLLPATALGSAYEFATVSPNPYISVERVRPKRRPIPLNHLDEGMRLHYYRWRDFYNKRDSILDIYRDRAIAGSPAYLYRYVFAVWTHAGAHYRSRRHFDPWAWWWAEQSDRFRWAHERYGRTWNPWNLAGPVIDPEFQKQLADDGLLGQLIITTSPRGLGLPSVVPEAPDTPQTGDFVVDHNNISGTASDSNDGQVDGTGFWLTESKAISEIEAGNLNGTAGDPGVLWIGSGPNFFTHGSALGARTWGTGVTDLDIKGGYPTHATYARWHVTDVAGSNPPLNILGDDVRFLYLDFECDGLFHDFGGDGFESIDCLRFYDAAGPSSDNGAPWRANDPTPSSVRLVAIGTREFRPGTNNNHEVYWIHPQGTFTIRNAEIMQESPGAVSDAPYHQKRSDPLKTQGQISIANSITAMDGTDAIWNMNGGHRQDRPNNLWYDLTVDGGQIYWHNHGDSGQDSGWDNRDIHSTWGAEHQNASLHLAESPAGDTGGNSGLNNTILDCLANTRADIGARDSAYDHNTDLQFTQFVATPLGTSGAYILDEFDTPLTNPATIESTLSSSGRFAAVGNLTFEDSPFASTPDNVWPLDPATFAVDAGSDAAGSASDSLDRGILLDPEMVTLYGIDILAPGRASLGYTR